MFIKIILSKRQLKNVLLIVVSLFLIWSAWNRATLMPPATAQNNAQRVAYLASQGVRVDPDAVYEKEITVNDELIGRCSRLDPYAGQRVKLICYHAGAGKRVWLFVSGNRILLYQLYTLTKTV